MDLTRSVVGASRKRVIRVIRITTMAGNKNHTKKKKAEPISRAKSVRGGLTTVRRPEIALITHVADRTFR